MNVERLIPVTSESISADHAGDSLWEVAPAGRYPPAAQIVGIQET